MSCSNIKSIPQNCCKENILFELPTQEYYTFFIPSKENIKYKLVIFNDATQKYYGEIIRQETTKDGSKLMVKSLSIADFEEKAKNIDIINE